MQNQYPYQQYGVPPKKTPSPLVIVIPAAIIVIVLIIALIAVLNSSGSDDAPDSIDNNIPAGVSDPADNEVPPEQTDDGIKYDDNGDPVFVIQELNNSSMAEYNNSNPITVEIEISAAGDANKLAAVETRDKKSLERYFIKSMFSNYSDSFDFNVSFIVADPIRVTYSKKELLDFYEIVYSFPNSVIEGSRHYPDAPSFEGMNRYIAVVFDESSEEMFDSANVISSKYGNAAIHVEGGSEAYIAIIDMDSVYYGFGLEVDGISPDSGGSASPTTVTTTVPPTTTTTTAPPATTTAPSSADGPPGEGPPGEGPPGEGPPR